MYRKSLWMAMFLVAVFLVALWDAAVSAQTTPANPLPRRTLAAERSWVKFGVVLGRLRVLNSHVGQMLTAQQEDPQLGIRESLSISEGSDEAVVHYELAAPELRLVVHFSGPDVVRIEKTPQSAGGGESVRFSQSARGEIEMIVGQGQQARRYRANSFWHLMLEHRDVCQTHLLPILESLRVGWQLDETADDIRDTLFRLAGSQRLPETDRWAALVKQLSRGTFQERQAAERELRQSGQAMVAYLDQLNPDRLDTEQRQRIRRIVAGLVSRTDDTPQRVALWLNSDQDLWLALMSQGDPSTRQLAAEHLARMRGQTVQTAALPEAGVRR